MDRLRSERDMSDQYRAGRSAGGSDFFEHHHEIFVPTTRTAEIFGNCHTSKAQFGESTELVDRKFGPFIDFIGSGSQIFDSELSDRCCQHRLLFVVERLHV